MYVPESFRQSNQDELLGLIERHSFALLVSHQDSQLVASHLPLLVERHTGACGVLHGHMARANPQWRELAGRPVLAVFSGPQAYVSPHWYGVSPMVPTWNYLAVHVSGRLEIVEGQQELLAMLSAMAAKYEAGAESPWNFAADDPYVAKLLKGIVGFRIAIERLDGKWKLGQNQPPDVRRSAAEELLRSPDPDSQAIGRLMLASVGDPPPARDD